MFTQMHPMERAACLKWRKRQRRPAIEYLSIHICPAHHGVPAHSILIFCGFLALLRGVDLNSILALFGDIRGAPVNIGKTLFAQLINLLPVDLLHRGIVTRYGGDQRVTDTVLRRALWAMAFAQLTYRESTVRYRDLPVGASVETLCHGLSRSGAPLDAGRCQRGARLADYAELAQRLIAQARKLYLGEDLGFDLANTVTRSIRRSHRSFLAVFPWAHFRTAKAVEKCTRCWICAEISRALSIYPTATPRRPRTRSAAPRGSAPSMSWIAATSFRPAFHGLHLAGAFFITRAKSNIRFPPRLLGPS